MYYNRTEKRRKYVKNENGAIHQYARNFFCRHNFRGRSSKNLQQKLLHDILNSSERK